MEAVTFQRLVSLRYPGIVSTCKASFHRETAKGDAE